MSVAAMTFEARRARCALASRGAASRAPKTVLRLHGDVEVSTALLLADSLSGLLALSVGDVVIDLADVDFIDLASARILDLARQRLARQGRDLIFRSPSRLAVMILGLFGLGDCVEAPAPTPSKKRCYLFSS